MLLSTEQAAIVAGVSPNTIRQWVARGHLRAYRKVRVVNGRARKLNMHDEREVLLAERSTRLRGGSRIDVPGTGGTGGTGGTRPRKGPQAA